MPNLRTLLATLLLFVGLAHAPEARAGVTLLVHAGAGIRPPLDELGLLFEQRTGTHVDFSYKGSGCLLADITFSKQGDVYIPGELFYLEQARARGFIADSRVVAVMATALIVQRGDPQGITTLADLQRPGLRVGLADPEAVAIGRAADEALTRCGLLEAVHANKAMDALTVVELGIGVKLGHLDAAIVWDATAHLFRDSTQQVPFPDACRVDSPVPAGVLSFSEHPQEAAQFVAFLASDEAAELFRAHGYGVPER
jgi:molybdate transport system substrate-binding protein